MSMTIEQLGILLQDVRFCRGINVRRFFDVVRAGQLWSEFEAACKACPDADRVDAAREMSRQRMRHWRDYWAEMTLAKAPSIAILR